MTYVDKDFTYISGLSANQLVSKIAKMIENMSRYQNLRTLVSDESHAMCQQYVPLIFPLGP